ncbi:uncharacterized protein [Rutidosis leptorrhynchoides]|uniref:uncharacterized protein n=1 Tax=Rutidosis leptorrhynchoides TaxID=125765 RepID=UPI003A99ECF4
MAEELDAEEAANRERVPRFRSYIHGDREEAAERLHKHYFQERPMYPDKTFRRRFRMSEELFLSIVEDISNYDAEPLPKKPNGSDIARLYNTHEEKHGFKGMLRSIDCMHWKWKNCPVAWKGQYTSGHQGHPTIVLEVVASYDM